MWCWTCPILGFVGTCLIWGLRFGACALNVGFYWFITRCCRVFTKQPWNRRATILQNGLPHQRGPFYKNPWCVYFPKPPCYFLRAPILEFWNIPRMATALWYVFFAFHPITSNHVSALITRDVPHVSSPSMPPPPITFPHVAANMQGPLLIVLHDEHGFCPIFWAYSFGFFWTMWLYPEVDYTHNLYIDIPTKYHPKCDFLFSQIGGAALSKWQ